MIEFLSALTVAAQAAVVAFLVLRVVEAFGGSRRPLDAMGRAISRDALKLAFLVPAIAMFGSLYFSERLHFLPCPLCWYQRICMYPLVLLLGIAALRNDWNVRWYAIPLAAIGMLVSAYHYQLERFPDQQTIACSRSVPCTTIWFEQFGYITIPIMAFSAFALVVVILIVGGRGNGQGIPREA